ncbi:MAG: hypothetical protein Q7R67_01285 [bacterium]|nr:hypothetical protein [bacterium]
MKIWLIPCLIIAFFLISTGHASAEITSPYTVDEKNQVMFADSTAVSGHEGLENYTNDYVGGFLHFTFTYTHHSGYFSDHPPRVYVTALDPRTTATPTVRTNTIAYQLLAGTHSTDWYSYDIQFDSTGYTVLVKQTDSTVIDSTHKTVTGITSTDWAALANTYDISPSSNLSMSFTPLLVEEVVSAPSNNSDSSSVSSSRSSRPGERSRCVDTNIGLYCPNEQTREWYIKFNMEMLIYLLQKMVIELSNQMF